jgi:predicted O-linked N-acetylglucosamine transferase (SPINDLY family)
MINLFRKKLASKSSSSIPSPNSQDAAELFQTAQCSDSTTYKNRGDEYFNQGQFSEAADCYRQAIKINPAHAEAHVNLSNALRELAQLDAAESALVQAISINPHLGYAYYNLAALQTEQQRHGEAIPNFNKAIEILPAEEVIYRDLCLALAQSGQLETAKQVSTKGISINPQFAEFHMILGELHYQLQEFVQAIACFKNVILIQPEYVQPYINIGKILQKQGKLEDVITLYLKALELDPNHAGLNFDVGLVFKQQGKLDDAILYYKKSLMLRPDFIEAQNNLGGIFKDQGKLDEAIACYQRALEINPESAEVYCNMGLILKSCGQLNEAVNYFKQAIHYNPNSADAHCNLGNASVELGNLEQAIACFHKTLDLKPDFTNAHYGLGALLMAQQKYSESIVYLKQVVKLEPNHYTAKTLILHQMQHMCTWENIGEITHEIRCAVVDSPVSEKNMFPPLAFLSIPGATAEEQKRCAERWVDSELKFLPELRKKLDFEYSHATENKIRIGYLSADFRQHPVSFLMAEVFELHNRSRFHITAYAYDTDGSTPMRNRLESAFDQFIDIHDLSLEDAAKRINADHIDILVDLTGHTQNSRTGILALRPAPVQVNYLGYPGTIGADFVDYLIADRFTIPPEMKKHYTEKVVWMPDCFQANDRQRPRPASPNRKTCGLPDKAFVFCCFNQTLKITPEMFEIWCRLLTNVPDSILWLSASTPQAEENLRREMRQRGLQTDRLIMAPLRYREEHLARLQCADLFLDTLPFNAGTTCSDALWMGLPVITCAGDAFASRMAGSLLSAIGMPELITYNLKDYYLLALDLSTNRRKLETVRSKIMASHDSAPLFDSPLFTHHLEVIFTRMMDAYLKDYTSLNSHLQ